VILLLVGALVSLFLVVYALWYYCQCIRSSAEGNVRAPDTMTMSADMMDIFGEPLKLISLVGILMVPALAYAKYGGGFDNVFRGLMGLAVFVLPMSMLAFVMFESVFCAVNPMLVLGSILSTFFSYLGLVVFFYGLIAGWSFLIAMVFYGLQGGSIMSSLLYFATIYVQLVGAHLLGRFFYKYQDRLRWDV
jgi:hypothetical protein